MPSAATSAPIPRAVRYSTRVARLPRVRVRAAPRLRPRGGGLTLTSLPACLARAFTPGPVSDTGG